MDPHSSKEIQLSADMKTYIFHSKYLVRCSWGVKIRGLCVLSYTKKHLPSDIFWDNVGCYVIRISLYINELNYDKIIRITRKFKSIISHRNVFIKRSVHILNICLYHRLLYKSANIKRGRMMRRGREKSFIITSEHMHTHLHNL